MDNQEDIEYKGIAKKPVAMENITGKSPYGMNRKNRRALFSAVLSGKANQMEVEKFKSLGKEAYPWLSFRDEIDSLKRKSLPVSNHKKLHKVKKVV